MARFAILFLTGALIGYTVGYRQGASGLPSIKEQALEKVGVYKVQEDHAQRQRAIEELQRAHADSIESAIHKTEAPH